ncbi:hypothetical protein PAHAL_2G063000 [Panicum hallii]|uniref:AAA+ ATPase domain-containing protein n=2 Tax=Panicum hallii TaxID=206008 RepID=A0A2T8KN27_9POAL|nr:hypothetical protein PAHAL_2G063000 [Panicum hallii]
MFGNRRRRLYTNKKNIDYSSKVWSYIDFEHPTTFDTLAMHPEKKRKIMDDLDDFRSSREYYRRIGKAWKRGYLLYGPPGTGKSSMIAAMSNYLNYDIYDIELTMVPTNNDLRKLFIETKGKSIIVIEDIDCSLDLTGHRSGGSSAAAGAANPLAQLASAKRKRTSEMTLSGLLNFIDGIWSAHSGERIIVFTTNHAERLDPALVRRGRMDMRVEMSYCCFEAFQTLAKNYLGVDAHPLFGAVEELLRAVEITPADVAECLMMSRRTERGADVCLRRLIDELKKRAQEKEEIDMKRAEKEAAASAAAGADAKEAKGGGEDMVKGRRMVDPRTIRRLRKATEEGDDKVATKPNGNDAMAADAGAIELSDDDSSSDHGDKAKLDVDAQAEAVGDGAEVNGDPSDAGDDDMDDYDDDMDDSDDDDDLDDYDDEEDDYDEDEAIFDD